MPEVKIKKGLIYSNQTRIFCKREIIGYGCPEFHIKEIDRKIANQIIRKNHYSKKVYAASYIHLGIYINGELMGVLQYGYAMNPASCDSVVEGTQMDEYLELNRMWLDDRAERNSESRAISYSIKYIRSKYPKIKWIQSFADERCGRFGIVYQASNFSYYGEHVNVFWEYKGEIYHNIIMTVSPGTSRFSKKEKELQENRDKAKKLILRQFRYIYFIDKRYKDKCRLKELPYPKHYKEV